MKAETFEKLWLDQVQVEKSMLLERAAAYATNGDRLGNFYEGGRLNGNHPMRYAFGLVSKHIIALRDLIVKVESGNGEFTDYEFSKLVEYTVDIRNYSVLIKAIYVEEMERRNAKDSGSRQDIRQTNSNRRPKR